EALGRSGACQKTYRYSSIANKDNCFDETPQTDQAGAPDYGGALDSWTLRHSRNSGSLPQAESPGLFHHSDHGLSFGGKEDPASSQKDQPRSYFRVLDFPRRSSGQAYRRAALIVW